MSKYILFSIFLHTFSKLYIKNLLLEIKQIYVVI